MPSSEQVAKFWRELSALLNALPANFDSPETIQEIDRLVPQVGPFAWEIGPDEAAGSFFALSPAGDPEALKLTRQMLEQAPSLPGWSFHPAKPARSCWGIVQFAGPDGSFHEVNAEGWRFVHLRFPDGETELLVEYGETSGLDEEMAYVVALLALDGLLGEERRIEQLPDVEVFTRLDERFAAHGRPLTELLSRL
ncbi:MAG: hypothetical protein AAF368_01270 [Planctomycetota bacterium]